MVPENAQQIRKAGSVVTKSRLGLAGNLIEVIVSNQKEQIALIFGVGKNRADPDTRPDSYFPGRGFVKTLLDE